MFFSISFSDKPLINVNKEMAMTVELLDFPEIDGDFLRVEGKELEKKEKFLIQYRIHSIEEKKKLEQSILPFMTCRLSGKLKSPPLPRNEHAFNYQRYLKGKDIDYIFELGTWDVNQCKKLRNNWKSILLHFRRYGIHKIEETFEKNVQPLMSALIFGEKSQIDESINEAYQKLGIAHLIAISGLHVGIITGLLYYVLLRIGLTKEVVSNFILLFLPMYAILAGASPSVNRAVLMTGIIVLSQKFHRQLSSMDAISISFLITIFYNPYLMYHAGFQLSYAVSFSLILSSSVILRQKKFFKQLFLGSFVAQISSLPLILYHFFEFSLISLFVNLLFIPLFSFIIIPLSFICYISLLIVPLLSPIFIFLLSTCIHYSNELIMCISKWDPFIFVLGRPSITILFIYVVCFLSLFLQLEKTMKNLTYFTFSLMFPIFLHFASTVVNPYGEVVFIDVGQGDSILIRLPFFQGTYLIDTGGSLSFSKEEWKTRKNEWNVGGDIVIPLLKSKGIRTIDKLILTHGDHDHIGAAKQIMQSFNVKELMVSETLDKKDGEKDIIRYAEINSIDIVKAYRGLSWEVGKHQFRILHPKKGASSSNNSSIVIHALVGGKKWLFTGDIEKDGEEEINELYHHLNVDILKVAHHGSNTSTTETFLKKIRPKISIISVGTNNRYGHPSESVLEELKSNDIEIFRTDLHGAIKYQFFLNTGTLYTCLPYDSKKRTE